MFRTEIDIAPTNLNLSLQDKVITMGSCFAEVIGHKLLHNKVDVLVNPFGTIFNPISVSKLLMAAAGENYTFEQHLVNQNDIWYAYDLHSSISSPSKELLLQQIQERLQLTNNYLKNASLLIITLGTSIAYQLAESGNVVANCHKLPSRNFNRVLLDLQETKIALAETLQAVKQINPQLNILFTVSPVRHIKETLTMNSVSKSELRLLCHYLQQEHTNVQYFPAYEVMMDDLRDYRFYKDDLIHPTSMAENYIWNKFVTAYFNTEFQNFITEWDKMKRALAHKPFHPDSQGHQTFLKSTLSQLQQLATKYNLNISQEQNTLRKQITNS